MTYPNRTTRRRPAHGRLAAVAAVLGVLCGCRDAAGPQLEPREIRIVRMPADGPKIPAPRGLGANADGEVFAVDTAGRILVFGADGKLRRQWRMPETEVGSPEDLTVLRDGAIAVPDTHYHRVIIFAPDGTVRRRIGRYGKGPGEFIYPVSLAEDSTGHLYVCEYGGNDRIQKFTADGTFVTAFGSFGTQPGQLQRPAGLVWYAGRLYVADAANHRVQVFGDDGQFLHVIVIDVAGFAFSFPYDIAVDRNGRLYTVEWGASRICRIALDGKLDWQFGTAGTRRDQFSTPWGIVWDGPNRVFVADTGNRRIVEVHL